MAERRRDRIFRKLPFGGRKYGQNNKNTGSLERESAAIADTIGKTPAVQVLDGKTPVTISSREDSSEVNSVTTTVRENKIDDRKESLWTRAFNQLRDEEPKLVGDYLDLLAGTNQNLEETNEAVQVANVIKKQKEIMEKKQWKLGFWHHEIIIRKKIDHILQAFAIFKDIGSAVALLDPVHAGIPWAGVCVLLQLGANDSEQHGYVLDGLISITDLINFYAQAESFYLSQNVNHEPLVELYQLVLEFQILAAGYFTRNTAARFTRNVLKLDGWSDKLTEIQKKNEECRKWAELSISKQIQRKLEGHLSTVNNDAAQAQKVLEWVSSISVRDQHVFVRESKLGRPYWNTGQWLIEHRDFCQWVQSPSGILYLEGGVGFGKSCLVSAVLEEHFRTSLDRLGFFYLSWLKSSTPPHVKEIPDSIQQRYKNRQNSVNGGSLSLRDCEDHIIELASGGSHITIIIDALDECGDHDKLLGSLKRIYGRLSHIHVFFSSRSMHLNVMSYFHEFSPIGITILDQSKPEMQSFIEREIQSPDRRRNSCIEKFPELEMRLKDTLVERAGAMFRWAELQLNLFLNPKRPIRHRKDFETKLNKLMNDSSLPTLNQVYHEIYASNVEPGSFDEVFATKALRCVLGAFQALNVHQLVDAVAIDPTGDIDSSIDVSYIMDICSNFIVVDPMDYVSVAHLSVREYLEQKKLDSNEIPIYSFTQAHRQLAESCLAVILHTGLISSLDVESRRSFLRYAIHFWPSHCEKIPEDRTTSSLSSLMAAIMTDKLTDWAVLARKISRKSIASNKAWSKLTSVPQREAYSYVVCAWGFVEFFNDTIQGTEPFNMPQRKPPLEVASFHGNAVVVRRIIDAAPEKNIEKASTAALVSACREGHSGIAEFLLSAGADPSPALASKFNGDFDYIVRLLINHGAVIDPPRPIFPGSLFGTPLQKACSNGHLNIVKVLVDSGAEINAPSRFPGSVLQLASWNGHENVVRFLLDHGADVNFGNGPLVSPLLAASYRGHHHIIRVLVEHGADPNPVLDALESPLQWTSSYNLEMVKLLIKHGANVNGQPGVRYGAPLETAAMHGQLEIVRFLLDSGADINAQTGDKKTAFVSAARNGYYDVVQLLLKRGVDVEKYGLRAFFEASEKGHKRIVELLMRHGVHMPDQGGGFSNGSDDSKSSEDDDGHESED